MRAGPRGEQSRFPGLVLATVGSAPAARRHGSGAARWRLRAAAPHASSQKRGSQILEARRSGLVVSGSGCCVRPRLSWQAASAVAVANIGDMGDMGDMGDRRHGQHCWRAGDPGICVRHAAAAGPGGYGNVRRPAVAPPSASVVLMMSVPRMGICPPSAPCVSRARMANALPCAAAYVPNAVSGAACLASTAMRSPYGRCRQARCETRGPAPSARWLLEPPSTSGLRLSLQLATEPVPRCPPAVRPGYVSQARFVSVRHTRGY